MVKERKDSRSVDEIIVLDRIPKFMLIMMTRNRPFIKIYYCCEHEKSRRKLNSLRAYSIIVAG